MSTSVSENRTVTPNEARGRLKRAIKIKRPVFLWGPPGIGKSELVADLTRELNGFMIDLRLGQMDPTDLRGIPFYNKETGKMDWAPPVDLPDDEMASQYPMILLFLDEMNVAPPAVQSSAYQLVLNRRLGKYKLPDNVVIVAAGNRESDKGVTFRMPSPLANRFVHLEVREDYDSWNEWAVRNRLHKDVVGYIGFAKQDLMDFNPRSSSRAFATPRSWSFVSEFLYDDETTDAELMDLIAGTIGDGLAVKFMAHRKVSGQMPNPADILGGKVHELKVKEVSAMYSLTVNMCYELQDALAKLGKSRIGEWHEMADNFFRFMMDNFTTELVVMGARVALTTYNLPLVPGKLKNFDEFHKRYGKYIIAAGGK
jgi:ATPase family associated with various cellular activities (AAA)